MQGKVRACGPDFRKFPEPGRKDAGTKPLPPHGGERLPLLPVKFGLETPQRGIPFPKQGGDRRGALLWPDKKRNRREPVAVIEQQAGDGS